MAAKRPFFTIDLASDFVHSRAISGAIWVITICQTITVVINLIIAHTLGYRVVATTVTRGETDGERQKDSEFSSHFVTPLRLNFWANIRHIREIGESFRWDFQS